MTSNAKPNSIMDTSSASFPTGTAQPPPKSAAQRNAAISSGVSAAAEECAGTLAARAYPHDQDTDTVATSSQSPSVSSGGSTIDSWSDGMSDSKSDSTRRTEERPGTPETIDLGPIPMYTPLISTRLGVGGRNHSPALIPTGSSATTPTSESAAGPLFGIGACFETGETDGVGADRS